MTCRVWWTTLRDPDPVLLAAASAVERERAAGFVHDDDRHRSLLGAGLLRAAVAELAAVPLADVVVRRACPDCGGPHGRPLLDVHGLHGSITHAGDLVGVALDDAGPVGLDVEPLATAGPRALDVLDLLVADGETRPRTAQDAVELWTAKEAVAKATGVGLRRPLADRSLDDALAAAGLVLTRLSPAPGHAAALASSSPMTAGTRSG